MESKDSYIDMARQMFNYLLKCTPETEICVSKLGELVLNLPVAETDWWPIMKALEKVVKKDGRFRMDYSKHHGLCEGLPFNLDFVFIKKGKSIHVKETRIARAFAVANGFYGIHFFCYYCGWCVFEITTPPGILVDPAWPPTYIIVDESMKARLSTEDESTEICGKERNCLYA